MNFFHKHVIMAETSNSSVIQSSSDQEERLVSARSIDNIGDKPNQPVTPKRKFSQTKPVFRSVQSAWFRKWPWLHYDQTEDKMFCHTLLSKGTRSH